MRWIQCQFYGIHDFNVDFIHLQEIGLHQPKWAELKKTLVLLRDATSTLAEVVYSYTKDLRLTMVFNPLGDDSPVRM